MERTALRPAPLKLGRAVPASVGLHVSLALALMGWELLKTPEPEPMIDLDQVVMVSLAPPKTTGLPTKASRTPTPPPQPDPTPAPDPVAEAPPPDPSEMVQHVEEPEERPPEQPKVDHQQRREDLLKQLRKQQALEDLDAPVGSEDRAQTSPDGVEGAVGSGAAIGDPALAAYVEKIRQALLPNFHPIQTEPLDVLIAVQINESGKIKDYKVYRSSGQASFDAAALRAVIKAGAVPPPPSEYLDQALAGLTVRFSNQDAL